uniref:4Fe-4S ferredoxin-type domain-containing protein n=1 Tax=Trichuris muris TaxID=70415 RepID=A0A5S6QJQ3_TRIMR
MLALNILILLAATCTGHALQFSGSPPYCCWCQPTDVVCLSICVTCPGPCPPTRPWTPITPMQPICCSACPIWDYQCRSVCVSCTC